MSFPFHKQMQDALDDHFADKGIDQFAENVERDGDGFLVSTTNGCIVGEVKGQQRLVLDQETEKFRVVS